MRMSKLFSQTLREVPSEAEIISHQLLLRAGYIRQHAAGIFSYMPLARRSLAKIEKILREEMDRIGGQEITMPVVQPAKLWQDTGRWYKYGDELGRFKDRTGREMVLAMTHEEATADLVRKEIRSYRQLPLLVYHIQTKWRDDPRPRGGLIRVREFTMKDSYSLDADWEGLEVQYRAHYQAYFNIFNRCGLKAVAVKSDAKLMGGKLAHEFIYLSPIGEDTIILCDACGYSANRQMAPIRKPTPLEEDPLPAEKVATPDCKTIQELANFLGIPSSRTAKAVFMVATIPEGEDDEERFVFAVVREPLSRLTSAFSYLSRGGNQSREDRAFARRWLQERTLTQFIDESLDAPEVRDSLFFRPQTDFLVDKEGRLGKLQLLRFENLDEDFRGIAPRLGVGEALPRLNAAPEPPKVVRLGRAQLEKVVSIYHLDYELLSYPSPLHGSAGPSESKPA